MTSCYCYYAMKGCFDPADITRRLLVEPTRYWSAGDCRKDGSKYGFALWETGFTLIEWPDVEIRCADAVEELFGKESILAEIKRKYDLSYVLEIVPSVHNGVVPVIEIGKKLIEFCFLTDTEIDIDMYVHPFGDTDDLTQPSKTEQA